MKYLDIITSPRFVQLVIIAVLQSLTLFNVIDGAHAQGLINIISSLFGASVVIGTVDKNVGQAKIAAAKVMAKISAAKKK